MVPRKLSLSLSALKQGTKALTFSHCLLDDNGRVMRSIEIAACRWLNLQTSIAQVCELSAQGARTGGQRRRKREHVVFSD